MGVKISAIPTVAASVASGDKLVLLDVSNTSESPQGTTSVVSPDVLSPYRTGAAVKAAYESEPSAFTDALFAKLNAIESGATADLTGAEIKALYETEPNAFTDAQFTKLSGVAPLADVSPVDSVAGKTGAITLDADDVSPTGTRSWFTNSEQLKLSLIENLATADQSDAEIKTAYENIANAFTDAEQTKVGHVGITGDVDLDLLLKLAPKAFFSFDPISSGVALEANSYNASSISRLGAGRYRVSFTANITPPYTVTVGFRDTTNTINIVGTEAEIAASIDVFIKNGADTLFDAGEMIHIVIHKYA